MAFTKLTFTKLWTSDADFPTVENSEAQVRADIQLLHDEAKAALNQLIDDLESTGATSGTTSGSQNIGVKSITGVSGSTLQGVLENIYSQHSTLNTTVNDPTTGLAHRVDTVLDTVEEAVESIEGAEEACAEAKEAAEEAAETAEAATIGKQDRAVVTDVTLSAANWVGSSAPYTYELSVSGVTATTIQEITFQDDPSEATVKALQRANIVDGGQTTGTITLKAWGTKPTTDLGIRLLTLGEGNEDNTDGCTKILLGGGAGGGFYVGSTAPSDTTYLWIDSTDNTLNYYDGTEWQPVVGTFGASS